MPSPGNSVRKPRSFEPNRLRQLRLLPVAAEWEATAPNDDCSSCVKPEEALLRPRTMKLAPAPQFSWRLILHSVRPMLLRAAAKRACVRSDRKSPRHTGRRICPDVVSTRADPKSSIVWKVSCFQRSRLGWRNSCSSQREPVSSHLSMQITGQDKERGQTGFQKKQSHWNEGNPDFTD